MTPRTALLTVAVWVPTLAAAHPAAAPGHPHDRHSPRRAQLLKLYPDFARPLRLW